jgi:hypothetical protein
MGKKIVAPPPKKKINWVKIILLFVLALFIIGVIYSIVYSVVIMDGLLALPRAIFNGITGGN